MNLSPALSAFLGFLLLRSALAKLKDPREFREILGRYPAGQWLRRGNLDKAVPAIEAALALGLFLPHAAREAAAYGLLAFLLAGTAGIGLRYLGGENRFACGCSGELKAEMPAAGMLIRNVALLAAAVCCLGGAQDAASLVDYLMGAALLLALALVEAALVGEGRIWKARG